MSLTVEQLNEDRQVALEAIAHDTQYQNFKGQNPTGTDFSGQHLEGCNFVDANLTNCNFDGAFLHYANLKNTIKTGATWVGTHIAQAPWIPYIVEVSATADLTTEPKADVINKTFDVQINALI